MMVPLSISDLILPLLTNVPLLLLTPFLLVEEEGVLVFQSDNEVVKFEKVRLELPEFVEVVFEVGNELILLVVFVLGSVMGLHSSISIVKVFTIHSLFICYLMIKYDINYTYIICLTTDGMMAIHVPHTPPKSSRIHCHFPPPKITS